MGARPLSKLVEPCATVFCKLLEGAIFEHMVRCGKHGGGNGADCFRGTTPGAQAQILSLEITVFLAAGRPCALYERGLQPGRAFLHARGAAMAGNAGGGLKRNKVGWGCKREDRHGKVVWILK